MNHWISLICLGGLILTDQVTKQLAKIYLLTYQKIEMLEEHIFLIYSENTGVFLEYGAHWDPFWRLFFFIGIVCILLCVIGGLIFIEKNMYRKWGLFLVFSGGVSNVIDRVFRDRGAVIDFLQVQVFSLKTGIINLADLYIFIGSVLFMVSFFLWRRDGEAE